MFGKTAKTQHVGPLSVNGTINQPWLDNEGYCLHLDYQPEITVVTEGESVPIKGAIVFKKLLKEDKIDIVVYQIAPTGGFIAKQFSKICETQILVKQFT